FARFEHGTEDPGGHLLKRRTFLRKTAASGLIATVVPAAAIASEAAAAASGGGKLQEIYTNRAPKPVGPFSQAIKANGVIFVAGQTARDPQSGEIIQGDITAPTERVMQNLKVILEAAGSSLDRTLKTTVYLKDMDDFDAMGKVYSRYFPSHPPARAAVEVSRLHGGRVEIELIALA